MKQRMVSSPIFWAMKRHGDLDASASIPEAHRSGRDDLAAVVRAAPDGYTLLTCVTVNAINATLYDQLNFNFIRDIAPVASIARDPFAIEVHPSVPVTTVPEFIVYAKANPGRINMASARHWFRKPYCR